MAEKTQTIETATALNLDAVNRPEYDFDLKPFDLGAREYLSPYNRIMPYNLRGIMGVPRGEGPFPVVLITHGRIPMMMR